MSEVSTREPLTIVQGDTLAFTKTLPDYKATDGWSLLYIAVGGNNLTFQFTSTADGSNHSINVNPDVTDLWLPGEYQVEGYAINQTLNERHRIFYDGITVAADLDSTTDVRTHAQRMIANCEAQLEALAGTVIEESDVEGTKILRRKITEFTDLRDRYLLERQAEVAKERMRNGRSTGRRLLVRFRNVGSPFVPISGFGGNGP